MATSTPRSAPSLTTADGVAIATIVTVAAFGVSLWLAGQTVSVSPAAGGRRVPRWPVSKRGRARADPATAWDSPMPPPATTGRSRSARSPHCCRDRRGSPVTRVRRRTRRKVEELASRPGMAKARDITRAVGPNTLLSNRSELRPMLEGGSAPSDLGWRWGRARGVDVYTSVRDSVVLLGPSGAGKGVYVVEQPRPRPPGAVVVTSTRPDVVAITMIPAPRWDRWG